MPAAPATKAEIKRTIEAIEAAGLTPCAVIVGKDGTIRIETQPAKTVDNTMPSAQVLKPKAWAKR